MLNSDGIPHSLLWGFLFFKNMDKTTTGTKLACMTLLIILLLILPASAQGTIVSIANVEAEYGSSITVPLMIYNVTNLGGGEVSVTYDPLIVHVTSVTKGDMNLGAYNINNASGWVYINTLSASGQSGDVAFAYIHLVAVGNVADVSPLNITVYDLFDTTYKDIQHTIINGTFTITSAITVVVNKTTVPNQTIEIDEAKNATNTVIELNAAIAANVTVTIKANTNASALNAKPATSSYGLAQNQHSLEKYIDVNVTGIDNVNLTFVSLTLYYTTADLDRNGDGDADDPGDLNETTLIIYWFYPNETWWMPLGPGPDADGKPDYTDIGGPKVIDDERNTTEKYLKVTLNHFSTFAMVAEAIPAPITPTPTPSNGRDGGGGPFLFTSSPTLTPSATPTPTESPTLAPTFTPSAPSTPAQTPSSAIPPPTTIEQKQTLMFIIGLMAVSIMAIIIYTAFKLRKK